MAKIFEKTHEDSIFKGAPCGSSNVECTLCCTFISVSKGFSSLTKHASSQGHKQRVKSLSDRLGTKFSFKYEDPTNAITSKSSKSRSKYILQNSLILQLAGKLTQTEKIIIRDDNDKAKSAAVEGKAQETNFLMSP